MSDPNFVSQLLDLLNEQPQTAELLAQQLAQQFNQPASISDLAAQLSDLGVPLQRQVGGYALAAGTPTAAAVRAAGFAGEYRYLAQVGSTQDEVRRWADDPQRPAAAGAVVLAESQRSGRGRRGRTWNAASLPHNPVPITPAGSALCFSVLLPSLPPETLPLLPLIAGVALQQACCTVLPADTLQPKLKWPNDLLSPSGAKLAGILLEAEWRGGTLRRAVLGIGLNVTAAPNLSADTNTQITNTAACLADLMPAPHLAANTLNRAKLLAAILQALEVWLSAPRSEVLAAWRANTATLGRTVRVQTANGVISGLASALTDLGELQILTDDQQLRTISAGDVELIGALR